jgi:hypothetical protein
VLCALASGGSSRRSWLLNAGILQLLHRLTMERARDVAGALGLGLIGSWFHQRKVLGLGDLQDCMA